MPISSALVKETDEIISDLLRTAEQLRADGEREAACYCIEAVFVLLGPEPRRVTNATSWADELEGSLVSH